MSYARLNKIVKAEKKSKIQAKKIRQFLEEQDIHSLTKELRKFKRLRSFHSKELSFR